MKFKQMTKPFTIPKELIMQAYRQVKANAGSAGIDQQTLAEFEKDWQGNLYKLWNRMSSGSYFPKPVKRVSILKKTGGERILGVPTIMDRIGQTTVRLILEPELEKHFHDDSYGYRPNRSAIDAVTATRIRCRTYDWLIEFDIKALFDTIPWDLLMKSVRHHTDNKWVLLYIERWLKAPMQDEDGNITERTAGTPQGGPASPLLSNLFMHYAFDTWMSRTYPANPWARYSDDGVIHCRTEAEAKDILANVTKRLKHCGIEIHPDKTRIVYCKDGKRRGKHANTQFDFLGYTFRPRGMLNTKNNTLFVGFTPGVSPKALKAMRQYIRASNVRNRSELSIQEIARMFNPILRGWINYYGCHHRTALDPLLRHFNLTLVTWARRKYVKLKRHKVQASEFVQKIARDNPELFEHWKRGMVGSFA